MPRTGLFIALHDSGINHVVLCQHPDGWWGLPGGYAPAGAYVESKQLERLVAPIIQPRPLLHPDTLPVGRWGWTLVIT